MCANEATIRGLGMFENVSEELANTILYGRKCLLVMIKMQKNGDIRNNAANISRRSYVSDWNKTSRFFMLLDLCIQRGSISKTVFA